MAAFQSYKLTRGLWGIVQGAVRDGAHLADVRAATAGLDPAPSASTLSHLYSRAVGGAAVQRAEADYRSRVDPDTYLARRPSGQLVSPLPLGFSMAGRWRQVVAVTGGDPLTGQSRTVYVNVQFDRLLSRGEAIELALGAVAKGSPQPLVGPLSGDYVTTWRAS